MNTPLAAFERTFNPSDSKKNIPFTFLVPTGTTQLNIRLTYSPLIVDGIHNLLTLSLFDPGGFRGAGHRHSGDHQVLIDAHHASPGYLAGPIQPGEWTVVVDTHMIYGASCSMRLEIQGTDQPLEGAPSQWAPGHTAARGRGWYRGDLHAHTIHSDARWDVPDLVAWSRSRGLDFATLSDHNTVSGLAQMDAARSADMLTMGGIELTTFWGHALALGLREWVDWRVRDGERTMEQIAAEVTARGGTFIIAHPASLGDPYCTGCRWVYETMMPGTARVVEAWNGPWVGDGSSNNEDALVLIYRWLNAGHRLALTAGMDHHGSQAERTAPQCFNVVYADELSEQEILRGLRAGHTYLSSGPVLELTANAGAQPALMGDRLNVARAAPLQILAGWKDGPPNAKLDFIVDGNSQEQLVVTADGSRTWALDGAAARWCLLTLRDQDGTMLALTNPIYLDVT